METGIPKKRRAFVLKQLRKCIFTWNNYLQEHDRSEDEQGNTIIQSAFYDRDAVIDYFKNLPHVDYVSLGWEIGEEGTPHIQGYIHFTSAKNFKTLIGYLSKHHIEPVRGTNKQAIDYTQKEGDYDEIGDRPVEKGGRSDLNEFFGAVADGVTNKELRDDFPGLYGLHRKKVDEIRLEILEERFMHEHRNVEVFYIHGSTGIGKTRAIYDRFSLSEIYRVPNYGVGMFDLYRGQDVLVLDEFTGSIKFTELLQYLDRYPVHLKARYADRIACFTKVFIISNEPIDEWYQGVQNYSNQSWQAFLRRIDHTFDFNNEEEQGLAQQMIGDMCWNEDTATTLALELFGEDKVLIS